MRTKQTLNVSRLKPAVPKCWLFALSGGMWSTVGLGMCATALRWLAETDLIHGFWIGIGGVTFAIFAFRWGFGKITRTNIRRLRGLPDKGCLFAFQAWKSYLIILFMIGLGVMLRHSELPKNTLAVVYIAIGGALFFSSFFYYGHIGRMIRTSRQQRGREKQSSQI